MKNQTIAQLYTDYKKTKFSNNHKDILKSVKKFDGNLYTRRNISRDAIDELLNFNFLITISKKHQINTSTFLMQKSPWSKSLRQ